MRRLTASRRGSARGLGAKKVKAHRRRTAVAQLYEAGHSQQEIAAEVGVDQSTVSRDISSLLTEWREHRVDIADRIKREQYDLLCRELAGLDRDEEDHRERKVRLVAQEAELMAGWERSKAPRRKTVSEQDVKVEQPGRAPVPTGRGRATVRTEDQIGDPRFHEVLRGVRAELRAVTQAISDVRLARTRISESIRRLLGADAPQQKAWTTPTGEGAPAAPAVQKTLVIIAGKDEIPRGLFLPQETGDAGKT